MAPSCHHPLQALAHGYDKPSPVVSQPGVQTRGISEICRCLVSCVAVIPAVELHTDDTPAGRRGHVAWSHEEVADCSGA